MIHQNSLEKINLFMKSKSLLFIFLFLSLFASANDTIPQRPNIIYILKILKQIDGQQEILQVWIKWNQQKRKQI